MNGRRRKPRGRKKLRRIIPVAGTQDVFVHCAYNCGRCYRTQRYGINKTEWHKTLRKLNAHESQRCPHRHGLPEDLGMARGYLTNNQAATAPHQGGTGLAGGWQSAPTATWSKSLLSSPSPAAGVSMGPSPAGNARTLRPVTAQKRTPPLSPPVPPSAVSTHPAVRHSQGFKRLMEAQERLKTLEGEMSQLRHEASVTKQRHEAERAQLVDENAKLETQVDALVKRAGSMLQLLRSGNDLPAMDLWEMRFMLADEHPDDFIKLAKSIEQARAAKDAELHRVWKEKSKADQTFMRQESSERLRRIDYASKMAEQERKRRLTLSSSQTGKMAARRLNERVKSLRLSDSVPLWES